MNIDAKSETAGTAGLSCSFCNAPEARVNKLIAGDTATICDRCIAKACDLIVRHATDRRIKSDRFRAGQHACSFCHKPSDHHRALVGSLRARVCDRCLCAILAALAIDFRDREGAPMILAMDEQVTRT